jgi:hypothetical protein
MQLYNKSTIFSTGELFWILGRGLRRAIIRCTLGLGKSKKGLGFWRGGHKGATGDKGE